MLAERDRAEEPWLYARSSCVGAAAWSLVPEEEGPASQNDSMSSASSISDPAQHVSLLYLPGDILQQNK